VYDGIFGGGSSIGRGGLASVGSGGGTATLGKVVAGCCAA
jgi:hypothetical protein